MQSKKLSGIEECDFAFNPKPITNPRKLYARYRFPFTFTVHNVNTLRYDLSIGSSTFTEVSEAPVLIQDLFQQQVKTTIEIIKQDSSKNKKAKAPQTTRTDTLISALRTLALELESYKNFVSSKACVDGEYLQQKWQYIEKNISTILKDGLGGSVKVFTSLEVIIEHAKTLLDAKNEQHKQIVKELDQLKATYKLMQNTSYSLTYHVPQVKSADYYVFDINVQPKTGIVGGMTVPNKEIWKPVRGGFRIGGSFGAYYSRLRNDCDYFTVADSITTLMPDGTENVITGSQVQRSDHVRGNVGAMALAHFSSRFKIPFNLGLSAGLGVPFNREPLPQGLIGINLTFGSAILPDRDKEDNDDKNRDREGSLSKMSIVAGFAFGAVDKLKSQYETGKFYTDASNITEKTLAGGWFVGVTYTLGGRKKKEAKPAPATQASTGSGTSGGTSSTAEDEAAKKITDKQAEVDKAKKESDAVNEKLKTLEAQFKEAETKAELITTAAALEKQRDEAKEEAEKLNKKLESLKKELEELKKAQEASQK